MKLDTNIPVSSISYNGVKMELVDVDGNELNVNAPTGSTVTVQKGDVVKTASENNGVWVFYGLDAGDWTVTASLGDLTSSQVVTIADETLELSYSL